MQTPEQKRSSGWQAGGRLFFHSRGVMGRNDVTLLTWTLPKESAYLRDCADGLAQLLARVTGV